MHRETEEKLRRLNSRQLRAVRYLCAEYGFPPDRAIRLIAYVPSLTQSTTEVPQ